MILDQINIQYYQIKAPLHGAAKTEPCLTVVLLKATESSDKDKELLSKMLGAVKRSMDDTTLITVSEEEQGQSIAGLFENHAIQQILVFGISPKDLGLNIKARLYQPQTMHDKQILFSHGLPAIIQKPEYKKPLWEALQQVFK